jgi:hypothetical protein
LHTGLSLFESFVNPAILVYPLVIFQIIEGRLPSLWNAENEKSDGPVTGVKKIAWESELYTTGENVALPLL